MRRAARPAATSSSMMPVPLGRASSLRMGQGLVMSKRRKRRRAERAWGQSGGHEDEGEELAGYFVDDDEAWVFAVGFAGGDGGGGDADEVMRMAAMVVAMARVRGRGEEVGGDVPEERGGGAAVGAGAWLEVAGAEEGGEGPGPEGLAGVCHWKILVLRGGRKASRGWKGGVERVVANVGALRLRTAVLRMTELGWGWAWVG